MSADKVVKDRIAASLRRAKAVAVVAQTNEDLECAETLARMAEIVVTVIDKFGGGEDEYGMKRVSMRSGRAMISIDGAIEEFVEFVDAQGPVRVITSTRGTVEEFDGRLPEVDLDF